MTSVIQNLTTNSLLLTEILTDNINCQLTYFVCYIYITYFILIKNKLEKKKIHLQYLLKKFYV